MKTITESGFSTTRKLGSILIAAGVLATASVASAADAYWGGGTTDISGNGTGASLGGAGTWDSSLINWDNGAGVPYEAWMSGDNAIFGGAAGGNVTVGSAVTVGGIGFVTGGYQLTGSNLTLNGAIDVGSTVNASIANIISSGSLTKTGAGILTLTGVNSYTGATTINGGTVTVSSGSLSGTSGVTINNGGTLEFSGATRDGLGSGNKTITINSGGTLLVSGTNAMGYNANTNYAKIELNNGGTFSLSQNQYIYSLSANGGQTAGVGAIAFWDTLPVGSYAINATTDTTINNQIAFSGVRGQSIFVANGATLTLAGKFASISGGTGSFTKDGDGTLVFSGVSGAYGASTINAGKVLINGDHSLATNSLTVKGGLLGGSGTFGGAIIVKSGATLSPGTLAGGRVLTTKNNVTLEAGAAFLVEIDAGGTAGQLAFDPSATNRLLTITGATLYVAIDGAVANNSQFIIAKGYSSLVGDFGSSVTAGNGQLFNIDYSGNQITLTAVPEPSTYAFLGGLAVFGVTLAVRRRSGK